MASDECNGKLIAAGLNTKTFPDPTGQIMTTPKINQAQLEPPFSAPLWKVLVLLAMLILAAISILAVNKYIGGLLFIAAILFQAYGGFGAMQFHGETRFRIFSFVAAWILVVILSVAAQYIVPEFTSVLGSLGADLPLLTEFTQKTYPLLLLFPWFVAVVWRFWPSRGVRLRIATILSWLCIGLILLMVASLYLPIFMIGPVD